MPTAVSTPLTAKVTGPALGPFFSVTVAVCFEPDTRCMLSVHGATPGCWTVTLREPLMGSVVYAVSVTLRLRASVVVLSVRRNAETLIGSDSCTVDTPVNDTVLGWYVP